MAALRFNVRSVLLLLPCALLVGFFVYDLGVSLTAPVCLSPASLGTGCLPLGWEGPFSDHWGNRSRSNAVIDRSLNLGFGLMVFTICSALLYRRSAERSNQSLIVMLQIGLVLALLLKSTLLNEAS
ncbi:hypothetical protein ILT44_02970 [Microvirga sp. BT689]|uniref:hypothetical protein n=1 Tax=Microvirga arvi TaxID=2778731 RepID=UPI00195291A7|nr:hypothetical protein [Microvirga arvi]MBM6579133.1 hypothetical protein [Microvirga arvi]